MMSTTYGTAYVSLAGALIIIASRFGLDLGSTEEIAMLIGAIVTITGSLATMIHRHSNGGVNAVGIRNAESDK